LISATHEDLAALVQAGSFRQDLYYRLNVIELTMPPLRECREDVPLIAAAILERLGRPGVLSPEAFEQLKAYDFPGNVRELENILERAVALSGEAQIGPEGLRLRPAPQEAVEGAGGEPEAALP